MSFLRSLALISFFFVINNISGYAVSTVNQTVSLAVSPITKIQIMGNPNEFIINPLNGNQGVVQFSDNSTAYSLTTNQSNLKIFGMLDENFPLGITLYLALEPPIGGSSIGKIALTAFQQMLINHIEPVAQRGLTMDYELTVDPLAALSLTGEIVRTLTLTVSP